MEASTTVVSTMKTDTTSKVDNSHSTTFKSIKEKTTQIYNQMIITTSISSTKTPVFSIAKFSALQSSTSVTSVSDLTHAHKITTAIVSAIKTSALKETLNPKTSSLSGSADHVNYVTTSTYQSTILWTRVSTTSVYLPQISILITPAIGVIKTTTLEVNLTLDSNNGFVFDTKNHQITTQVVPILLSHKSTISLAYTTHSTALSTSIVSTSTTRQSTSLFLK